MENKLDRIVDIHLGSDLSDKIGYRLMPISRVWLHANPDFGIGWYGNISLLYTIGTISGFILLIACINYVNLATARSQSRAGEVGLRKAVGATRNQLARQFLGESVLVALLATGFGIILAKLLLPTFNDMTQRHITFDILTPGVLAGLFGIIVVAGLLAGLYPAIVLSSYSPTRIARGAVARTVAEQESNIRDSEFPIREKVACELAPQLFQHS